VRYLGSKRKLVKHLLPIIKQYRLPQQLYIEPFVGGANMIEHVDNPRVGYDNNPYLIALLNQIQDDPSKLPKDNTELTEEDYNFLKKEFKTLPAEMHAIIGFAGFPISFGAKWFGGWSRSKRGDDYVARAYRNACAQHVNLKGVQFIHCDYTNLHVSDACIYCDPPYANTTKYSTKFDHNKFYQWCRDKAAIGNTVLVSEYNAPVDFECVFEFECNVNFASTRKTADRRVERLFLVK